MDYNQNRNNGQWDKWNSNASHNSYYNQPTHKPYGQGFSIASAVCGLLSLMTCCTIVLSLPLGALGILFAVLAHRKGKPMSTTCVTGLTLSIVSSVIAAALIIYSLVMIPIFMKNDVLRHQLDTMSERMYGITFTELMEEYYGYTIEE